MRTSRPLVAVVGALLLAACGDGEPDATPTPPASVAGSPTASPTPVSTLPPGVDQLVTIRYAGGKVSAPSGRVKVKRGSTVQLVVTSDKADEVHLHGYDKSVDVAAGGTARLTFKASIPGVFEVELEHRKVTLVRLQVQ
jgi:hypothetical protein